MEIIRNDFIIAFSVILNLILGSAIIGSFLSQIKEKKHRMTTKKYNSCWTRSVVSATENCMATEKRTVKKKKYIKSPSGETIRRGIAIRQNKRATRFRQNING